MKVIIIYIMFVSLKCMVFHTLNVVKNKNKINFCKIKRRMQLQVMQVMQD